MPIRIADVDPKEIDWLWEQRIPAGMLTILQGHPNCGKSSVTIDLAARVSRGDRLPLDSRPGSGSGRPVLFIAPEDPTESVLLPRLKRAEADLELIHVLDSEEVDELDDRPDYLEKHLRELEPALVIVDPITAIIGTGSEKQVRQTLHPWARAAQKSNAAILLIRHFQKEVRGEMHSYGLGSIALSAIVRSTLSMVSTSETSNQSVLSVTKHNLTIPPPHLRVAVGERIEWLGTSLVGAAELLGTSARPKRDEAKRFLIQLLFNHEMRVPDIKKICGKHGLAWGTVLRAAAEMRIERRPQGFGKSSTTIWRLPLTSESDLLRYQFKSEQLDNLLDDLQNPCLPIKESQAPKRK